MFTPLLLALVTLTTPADPLVAGKVYDLPKPGKFDVMAVDNKFHHVFAAHAGANSLAVLDTETGKVQDIETGAINGVAVAGKLNRIFVAGANAKIVALDRETLKVLGSADLGGPGDTMAVDSKRGKVYVGHDDGTELWVFDGATLKPEGTVTIEEAPEFIEYEATTDRLYQNIKSTDHVQVIDPETKKVVSTWSTGEMKSPHGIAVDRKAGRIYSAGRNGKLVVLDAASGKIIATTDIATGTDQIAMDASLHRIYCPGSGKLTILETTEDGVKKLGEISIPKGVHTLAVNSKTHDLWVCYGDATSAHIAQYTVQP